MQLERHEGIPVMKLKGDVDITRAIPIRDKLFRALTNQDYGLIVDMREVTYLDSAGVHLLFEVSERLTSRQQALVAVVPDRAIIQRVLELVDLRSVMSTHETLEEAIAAVKALVPPDAPAPDAA